MVLSHSNHHHFQLENIEDEVKNTFPFPCAFGVGVDGTNLYVTSQEDERLYLHRSGKLL